MNKFIHAFVVTLLIVLAIGAGAAWGRDDTEDRLIPLDPTATLIAVYIAPEAAQPIRHKQPTPTLPPHPTDDPYPEPPPVYDPYPPPYEVPTYTPAPTRTTGPLPTPVPTETDEATR